ncbi:hypothetical protein [Streptomyces sp. cg35]|uniref:hypothetical protein n=1 Tax=Streptomyces sp. cg35 TaxID=3421650 RepID=UPI003D17D440
MRALEQVSSEGDQYGESRERRPWWARWMPLWVNLVMGVPAVVPLHSAWVLLTKYRSCAFDTAGVGETDCGGVDVIEGAGWARLCLVGLGGLVLLLVVTVDVLFPVAYGRRVRAWLCAALLVPVPYLVTITVCAVIR